MLHFVSAALYVIPIYVITCNLAAAIIYTAIHISPFNRHVSFINNFVLPYTVQNDGN